MGLNPQQQLAAETIEGPLLILAGAGSGKTTVLMNRIGYMIENGIQPYHILAVTFTNKAAKEMRERISAIVGTQKAGQLWMSTFHSMCVKILRREAGALGVIDNRFTVQDPSDVKNMLKQIIKELGYAAGKTKKDEGKEIIKPETMYGYISQLKNEMVDVQTFLSETPQNTYIDWDKAKGMIDGIPHPEKGYLKQIYPLYQTRLIESNAMDFDDLILHTIHLFLNNQGIREKYQERFRYLMVDEYQDTNHAQYVLVKLLADKYRNLAVVGDDQQSIYRFRGSDIRNILHFDQDYPDAKVIKLEQNYRSTKTILQAANEVIAHNTNQKKKTLFTDNHQGELVHYVEVKNDALEAHYVAEKIDDYVRAGYDYKDIAILYRNNQQSGFFETTFKQKAIPAKVYGGLSFFDRMEIKDIAAYLRFIVNPKDTVSFARIVNKPKRSIGETTIQKIVNLSLGQNMIEFLENPDNGLKRLTANTKKGLADFVEVIKKYRSLSGDVSAASLMESLIKEINYMSVYQGEERTKIRERKDHLDQFIQIAQEKEMEKGDMLTLEELLEDAALRDGEAEEESDDMVKLMTIHGSKGLEFPIVFLVGMKNNGFPASYALTEEDVEEERRLCYVAFTRAKEKLHLSYPQQSVSRERDQYGIPKRINNTPSLFLDEFNKELLEEEEWDMGYLGWL